MKNVDQELVKMFSKKVREMITFAERDSWKKYHVVIEHPIFGEASFHNTSFANMKWEINEFCKDGSRF